MTRFNRLTRVASLLAAAPALATLAAQAPVASEFEKLHFRSIGPATMSGRIADIAVYEANPAIWYVGAAHGGVWKTTSNGALMTPLLQDKGLLSIGDIAVSQLNPDVVYVGTGESNNRQSTSWGEGVYKSTDGGKTWAHIGLRNSKHINRIILDPNNNDVVLVAATGPLFGSGGERGVFKSTDGGKTWRNVLKVDDWTGANDLVVSQTEPNVMYASTYQRQRTACCMNGGGPGSGIWKSTDAGEHWTRLTGPGLPTGSLGRIGLDVYRRAANIVYASIEGPGGGGGGAGGRGGPVGDAGTTGIYRSDDGGTTWRKLHANNPRPMYFSQVRIDPNNPDRVYMGGVGLQMTIDGGKSWETDAALVIHDDIHAIWIDPNNSDHLMIGNDGGLAVSYDRSHTWTFVPNLPVGLFYHVGYDMEIPFNVCGGMQDNYDWCGPSRSRHTAGIYNYDWFQVLGGDGFVSIPDLRDSRIVYTESQDGNVIRRNKVTGESKSIRPSPANVVNATPGEPPYRFHWDTPLIHSPNDAGKLLIAANKLFISTDRGDSWTAISPDLTSNANRDTIVTMGLKGSDITISRNDGISQWPAIVAVAEGKGNGVYFTGTDDGTLSKTTDGGKTWANITSKVPGFPAGSFVSKIAPSAFDPNTVYLTVDNHRLNDYETHMWVSHDLGNTWASMNGNLSGEVIKTLTEDTRNADVLYAGAETGIFVSLDRGKSWRRFKANLPTVRVDELTIHPRDNALLVATHGRALWILDDLSPIQEFAAATAASSDAKLFTPGPALQWKNMDNRNDEFWGHQFFIGENPPLDAVISYNLKKNVPGLMLRINDAGGRAVRTLSIPATRNQAGIQTVCWDQRVEPIVGDTAALNAFGGGRGGRGGRGQAAPAVPGIPVPLPTPGYLPANPCVSGPEEDGSGGFGFFAGLGNAGPHVLPGSYTVQLVANNQVLDSKPLNVVGDPAVRLADNERKNYNNVANDLHELQRRATGAQISLNALNRAFNDATPKVKDAAGLSADVKSQFDALAKEWEGVRRKFGVGGPAAPAGGRGGGGGRGAAVDPENVVARLGAAKSSVAAFWETPSASVMQQYNDAKAMLPKAIAEANAFIAKAAAMSNTLKAQNITFNVPSALK